MNFRGGFANGGTAPPVIAHLRNGERIFPVVNFGCAYMYKQVDI
jgi:hypothetical protein